MPEDLKELIDRIKADIAFMESKDSSYYSLKNGVDGWMKSRVKIIMNDAKSIVDFVDGYCKK